MNSSKPLSIQLTEGLVQGGILTLSVLTALVHLFLAFSDGLPTRLLPILFLFNGIGYLVLLVALYSRQMIAYQRLIRWVLVGYTVLTVIVWAFMTHASFDPFDYTDKLIELSLIVFLVLEDRQSLQGERSENILSSARRMPGRLGTE